MGAPRLADTADMAAEILREDGIVALPPLLPPDRLARLQSEFRRALARPTWNAWQGYEQTEKWRLMVEHALLIDPTAAEVALHPLALGAIRAHVGPDAQLVEAKGWRTVPTRRDFHGWHGDAWFHPSAAAARPREVKLAIYLTDVTEAEGGHFSYVTGSHDGDAAPRHWSAREVERLGGSVVHARGPAGTAILFDTWGVHRQSTPVLKPREALFFGYHDPAVPLQDEDREHGRYHPLLLNAGFLPAQPTPEQMRALGFGGALGEPVGSGVAGRHPTRLRFPLLHAASRAALAARLELLEVEREWRRIRRGIEKVGSRLAARIRS